MRKPPPVLTLSGVSCASAKVCEAVGYSGAAGVAMRTTNGGKTWAAQPLPARVGQLTGVACPSAEVCEAVGSYSNNFTFVATGVIVGTTDGGKTWRRQTTPLGTKSLSSVTCPTVKSCIAVGFGFNDYNLLDYGAVLGTTNGGRVWDVDTLPTTSTSVAQATAVNCPSVNSCYLGGFGVTGTKGGDVILRSADFGAIWKFQKLPSSLTHNSGLVSGLACVSDTKCSAVDNLGSAMATANGTTWAAQPVPHGVVGFGGVSCVGAGVCKAAGALKSGKGVVLGKTATGSWTAQTIPAGVGALAGVACVPGGVCDAVGVTNSVAAKGAAIGTANGGKTWTAQPLVNGIGLTAAACGSASACEAVGTNGVTGAIVGTSNGGGSWARQPVPSTLPPTTRLSAVACPSASVCEAVGFGPNGIPVALGTANGGKTWVDQSKRLPSGAGAFAGLACPSTSVCEAGGSESGLGFIIRTGNAGKTWTFQFLNFQATAVNGISCLSATVCTALGENGTKTIVLQTTNGGKAWTARNIASVPFPTGIGCATPTVCEVTGFRFSNTKRRDVAVLLGTTNGWKTSVRQTVPSGTTELYSVACQAKSQCMAVGDHGPGGGVLLGTRNGGATWSPQTIPSGVNTLTGVSCRSARSCVAAGLGATAGGVVLTRHLGG